MNCGVLHSFCWIQPKAEDDLWPEIQSTSSTLAKHFQNESSAEMKMTSQPSSYDQKVMRNNSLISSGMKKKKRFQILWRKKRKRIKPSQMNRGCNSDGTSDLSSNYNNEQLKALFPISTVQERNRFLKGRTLDRAAQKMETFMMWRQEYHLFDENVDKLRSDQVDEQLWQSSVSHAAKYQHLTAKIKSSPGLRNHDDHYTLPRIVKFGEADDFRASNGKRILLVLPGLIDKSRASLDFYATCVALFLYFKLDRHSEESIYVLIDVRAGRGWPNPPPTALIPFVKSLSKLIMLMPERMYECILFPLPNAAKPIWGLFKPFIDPKVVQKIKILFGPAGADSDIPKSMEHVLDTEVLELIVQSRQKEFK